jgi:ABC-type sugar transport system ATPase subunit
LADPEYVIEMLNITKIFPGIKANDDITLQLKRARSTRCSAKTAPANRRL